MGRAGRLEGKVAIITGAAGDIGRATAHRFAADGARLALIDADAEANEAGAAAVISAEARSAEEIIAIRADVTSAEEVAAYSKHVAAVLGTPTVVFNNAAIEGVIAPSHEYDQETFECVLKVNVLGAWLNLAQATRVMLAAGIGGSIINMASGAALRGLPYMSAYVASKHVVLGLTRTAALELARSGIRVNALCPGPVATRMMDSLERQHEAVGISTVEARQALTDDVPMHRYGHPEEVAELATFLASDAASYITGAAISIDGGRSAA